MQLRGSFSVLFALAGAHPWVYSVFSFDLSSGTFLPPLNFLTSFLFPSGRTCPVRTLGSDEVRSQESRVAPNTPQGSSFPPFLSLLPSFFLLISLLHSPLASNPPTSSVRFQRLLSGRGPQGPPQLCGNPTSSRKAAGDEKAARSPALLTNRSPSRGISISQLALSEVKAGPTARTETRGGTHSSLTPRSVGIGPRPPGDMRPRAFG